MQEAVRGACRRPRSASLVPLGSMSALGDAAHMDLADFFLVDKMHDRKAAGSSGSLSALAAGSAGSAGPAASASPAGPAAGPAASAGPAAAAPAASAAAGPAASAADSSHGMFEDDLEDLFGVRYDDDVGIIVAGERDPSPTSVLSVENLFKNGFADSLKYSSPPVSPERRSAFSSPVKDGLSPLPSIPSGRLMSEEEDFYEDMDQHTSFLGLPQTVPPAAGMMSRMTAGVAGNTLNDLFGAYFRVLIPKNENIPWDVPWDVCGTMAMCRCLMEHSSALCTLLLGLRRYVLGTIDTTVSYCLVGVDRECRDVVMQTDEHGRVYIEESAVDVQGNVPTTDNHGEWILEGNEIRHHSGGGVSAPFSADSILPRCPVSDLEARKLIVHLTYTLMVWRAGTPERLRFAQKICVDENEPWLFHRGVEDIHVSMSSSASSLHTMIPHTDPVQKQYWRTYFEHVPQFRKRTSFTL